VTVLRELPRYVIAKPLKNGAVGYYFSLPTIYRKADCPLENEPLGTDYVIACGKDGKGGRAEARNAALDEWLARAKGLTIEAPATPRFGSVAWLFAEYKSSQAYLEKVSKRSRPDYERTMLMVAGIITKKGDSVGSRLVTSITPRAADKLYRIIKDGPEGAPLAKPRPRQAEKAVGLCRHAWKVVRRLYPGEFDKQVPNPWEGVTMQTRAKAKKPAATREQVYGFAWGAIERGQPEAAAVAVICFEWLQRPENVVAGFLRWTDYRGEQFPNAVRIEHHKTGEMIWHPLQEDIETEAGIETVQFYPEAEAVLEKLPRRGVPMILHQPASTGKEQDRPTKPYVYSYFQKIIQWLRREMELPESFTLDACRHGGMTELEEAELTEGQGRALSAHRTTESYHGYAKRTLKRALGATRKRRAHVLAQEQAIEGPLYALDVPKEFAPPGLGYVYFVQAGTFIKIGFTSHLPARLAELSVGSAEELKLVRYEIGDADRERHYHVRFAAFRMRGEWFKLAGELAQFLREPKRRTPLKNGTGIFRIEASGDESEKAG
jgi:hypothetical protein